MSGTPKRMVDIETPCRRGRDAPPPSRSPPAHPTTTATTNISTQCSPRPTARRTTTHRVHLEPDKQHHDETTPSGGGSTSSGAQHTPVSQCGSAVRDKVLLSCRNHPHGQPSSCKLMSFLVLFTILSICSQFVLDSFNLFSICYQFFHFVFNSLNLFSILSIRSQFI
jgi:hypothetical protein